MAAPIRCICNSLMVSERIQGKSGATTRYPAEASALPKTTRRSSRLPKTVMPWTSMMVPSGVPRGSVTSISMGCPSRPCKTSVREWPAEADSALQRPNGLNGLFGCSHRVDPSIRQHALNKVGRIIPYWSDPIQSLRVKPYAARISAWRPFSFNCVTPASNASAQTALCGACL